MTKAYCFDVSINLSSIIFIVLEQNLDGTILNFSLRYAEFTYESKYVCFTCFHVCIDFESWAK